MVLTLGEGLRGCLGSSDHALRTAELRGKEPSFAEWKRGESKGLGIEDRCPPPPQHLSQCE